jgi:hypothetical protein
VGPDDEAQEADRDHGVGHRQIAEHRLLGEGRDDVADHAEARQDQDVDFRVAEEPEQVLEHQRVAAAGRVEEVGAEIAVGQQHGDGAGQHRQRQQQQEHGHQDRPDEQRHPVQRHARRAHVEDGGDEVDRAQDRRGAGQVDREDRAIHRRAGVAGGRERRIERPAAAEARPGPAVDESRSAAAANEATSSQKLMLFIRGKAMSGAPIISGTNQLPKPPIIAGMTMKKIMIRPWAVATTL